MALRTRDQGFKSTWRQEAIPLAVEDGKLVLSSCLNPDPTKAQPVHETMTRQPFLTAKIHDEKTCFSCEMGRYRVLWEQSEHRPAPPIGVRLNSQFLHDREPKGHTSSDN